MSSITLDGNSLVLKTPYKPDLVADLKARVPATDRKWDGGRKVWLVSPKHGKLLADLVLEHFNEMVMIPQAGSVKPRIDIRVLDIRYLGTTKDRGDDTRSAFGYCNGQWSVIIPETVLRAFFLADADERPGEAPTLYGVLGVPPAVGADELKIAYRRMAKIWHPDVSKDPEAEEQFKSINHAYTILSDARMRAKYDAGRKLEASLGRNKELTKSDSSYRAPYKCGYVLAEGSESIGRFVISKILDWRDIYNAAGQMLVTSWPMNAKYPEERWV